MGGALLFVFTGIGHFALNEPMQGMLPPWVPQREALVHASGLLEWLIAAGLLFRATRGLAAIAAITVLIGFLPLNVYAAWQHVDIGGSARGVSYLWLRVPAQALMVGWIYWFLIRPTTYVRRST